MFTKRIKYTDFNGLEREENFYFNLTKAELQKMNFADEGGLSERLQKAVDAKNFVEIMEFVNKFILMSYGEKSEDGRYFIKNDTVRERFECSEPYNILYMELTNDAEAAASFIKAVLPSDLAKQAEAALSKELTESK